jgi:hypothetical protein
MMIKALIAQQDYFKNDTLALIGYGSQGHGQGLNLRDNGLNVIIGVRKDGASWKEAVQDGWVPGTNLFEVDEAINKGTIIMNLLSDAAQSSTWPHIKPMLTKGKVSSSQVGGTVESTWLTDSDRLYTSPTASLQSSRTRPRLRFRLILMSSLLHQRVLVALYARFSRKVVASTAVWPYFRM